MSEIDEATLVCSFCNKSRNDVTKLIAGPEVYICNECVDLCYGIINEDTEKEEVIKEM